MKPGDHSSRFEVPTLQEIVALASRKGAEERRVIGLCPKTRHPTYRRGIGLPLAAGVQGPALAERQPAKPDRQ